MAIVNGFDTKKICAQLQRDPMYEIFHSGDDYYIVDGVTMIRCDWDVIEKLRPILGMKIPDYNDNELEAQVWTDKFSFKWKAFDVSDKLM